MNIDLPCYSADFEPPINFVLKNLHGGGAERAMVQVANGLSARKCEVTVILLSGKGVMAKKLAPDVKIVNLNTDGQLASSGKAYTLRILGRIRARADQVLKLVRLFREMKKGSIVISALNDANFISVLSKTISRSKAPIIVSQHSNLTMSLSAKDWLSGFHSLVLPWSFRNADAIVGVSLGVSEDLIRRTKADPEKVITIQNPILSSELANVKSLPRDRSKKSAHGQFLFVGRLVGVKRVGDIIEALAILRLKGFEASLTIVGKGPQEKELKSLCRRLKVEDHVRFLGFQEKPYEIMAQSSCLVLSSEYEGLPTVIVEALAMGISVIASDCDFGPREILRDGEIGWLFPVGNVNALAEKMEKEILQIVKPRPHDLGIYDSEFAINRWMNLINKLSTE